MVVPLTMPITRWMRSPTSDSRSGRMSGMPPATAASKSRSTPARLGRRRTARRRRWRAAPCWPVTTGLPALSASRISSRAGSMPPMTSTTTSTSGSSTTAAASLVSTPSGRATSRSLRQVAHGDAGDLEAQAGAGLDVVGPASATRSTSGGADVAAPEHPDPHRRPSRPLRRTRGRHRRERRARAFRRFSVPVGADAPADGERCLKMSTRSGDPRAPATGGSSSRRQSAAPLSSCRGPPTPKASSRMPPPWSRLPPNGDRRRLMAPSPRRRESWSPRWPAPTDAWPRWPSTSARPDGRGLDARCRTGDHEHRRSSVDRQHHRRSPRRTTTGAPDHDHDRRSRCRPALSGRRCRRRPAGWTQRVHGRFDDRRPLGSWPAGGVLRVGRRPRSAGRAPTGLRPLLAVGRC